MKGLTVVPPGEPSDIKAPSMSVKMSIADWQKFLRGLRLQRWAIGFFWFAMGVALREVLGWWAK